MFNLGDWALEKLIAGVKRGDFSREYAGVKIADYITKNVMNETHALIFDTETAEIVAETAETVAETAETVADITVDEYSENIEE